MSSGGGSREKSSTANIAAAAGAAVRSAWHGGVRLAKGEGVLVAADGTRHNNRAPAGRTDQQHSIQTAVQLPIAVMMPGDG